MVSTFLITICYIIYQLFFENTESVLKYFLISLLILELFSYFVIIYIASELTQINLDLINKVFALLSTTKLSLITKLKVR